MADVLASLVSNSIVQMTLSQALPMHITVEPLESGQFEIMRTRLSIIRTFSGVPKVALVQVPNYF